MALATVHHADEIGKPADHTPIPATIPDTAWIHAGSLIQSLLAELKDEIHEGAFR